MKLHRLLPLSLLLSLTIACGGSTEENNDANNSANNTNNSQVQVPTTYTFADAEGKSTVSYSGQTARHVLIEDLKSYMGALTDNILTDKFEPTEEGSVVAELNYYLRFDGAANGDNPILLSTDPAPLQSTYNEISTNKQLLDKLAGNDASTDHKNWTGGDFKGWANSSSPQALVESWFEIIEDNSIALYGGAEREVYGQKLPVYVTESGLDLQQLTQKFLVGAIAFSQAADDYGDDDKEGKGLLSPNTKDGDSNYTSLAHAWDEAFGYFGASAAFADLSDEEIANGCQKDLDNDGKLNLKTEACFGASTNAAKRDIGAKGAPTDLTKEAFEGFLKGRALIAAAGEQLTEAQLTELKQHRDQWSNAWEKAYAATVIHYINDVLADMESFGAEDYSFVDHVKHWSELKGFALSFQFNPRSPLSDADFEQLHALLKDAPVLPDADAAAIEAYKADLIKARSLLKGAYQFDDANVNGW